ncbi:MAG: hypothetical protein P8P83_00250 [Rickettsiaceae bacterium]|nr:hypothetical protein [Rickettsiaceae bacterium]
MSKIKINEAQARAYHESLGFTIVTPQEGDGGGAKGVDHFVVESRPLNNGMLLDHTITYSVLKHPNKDFSMDESVHTALGNKGNFIVSFEGAYTLYSKYTNSVTIDFTNHAVIDSADSHGPMLKVEISEEQARRFQESGFATVTPIDGDGFNSVQHFETTQKFNGEEIHNLIMLKSRTGTLSFDGSDFSTKFQAGNFIVHLGDKYTLYSSHNQDVGVVFPDTLIDCADSKNDVSEVYEGFDLMYYRPIRPISCIPDASEIIGDASSIEAAEDIA